MRLYFGMLNMRNNGKIPVTCEACGTVKEFPPYRFKNGRKVRFCSNKCRAEHPNIRNKPLKYVFTSEMDAMIKRVYENNIGRQGLVKAIAKKIDMPRWRITKRAIEKGYHIPLKKEPEWSSQELNILERYAHRHPLYIQKKLKSAGFHRSETAIFLKRKRMKFLTNLQGMSARLCAEFFGIDVHWVTDKIEKGLLKAEKRGTMRTESQGGDIWFIREKDIREFIIENPELIDLRKVEKFYFIELLANGAVH
jgi:hypothetical protein